jgi:hypothetical protein
MLGFLSIRLNVLEGLHYLCSSTCGVCDINCTGLLLLITPESIPMNICAGAYARSRAKPYPEGQLAGFRVFIFSLFLICIPLRVIGHFKLSIS